MSRHAAPIRQLANASVAKNAAEAAVCPDGKALKRDFKLGPFQVAVVSAAGRGRPVAIFTTRAAIPASAQARIIAITIRIHLLLPRHQANPSKINPSTICSGQSPNLLTPRRKLLAPAF